MISKWIKVNSLVAYFILAYAISWAVMLPIAASAQGWIKTQVPYSLHYLASFGPMLSALIISAITAGGAGVRKLLSGLFRWRVPLRYYAFAILGPIALFIFAVLLTRLVTGDFPDLSLLGEADYLGNIGVPAVLLLWFLTYGMGEEVGWRGFALPRLQRNHPAANAGLILGLIWAGWHLPAFLYRDTYTQMTLPGFPLFVVSVVFASVVFTWLYNSTTGSLLLVILFHVFFNWLSVSEAGGQYVGFLMTAPVIIWSIYVVRRYQPENASPLAKQVA